MPTSKGNRFLLWAGVSSPPNGKSLYIYDANGNLLSEVCGQSVLGFRYNARNQLTSAAVNGVTVGVYTYNAHGDVVNLSGSTGTSTKSYKYDAFGNEDDPDEDDPNPFLYCAEYFDKETGTYYLRARYYDPTTGRFTQQDTHWNTANSIYGDNPQKINEREDKLGLKYYSYAPQITAIMQSGNRYVYSINSPIRYRDPSGKVAVVDDLAIILIIAAYGIAAPVLFKLLQEMGKRIADLYSMGVDERSALIAQAREKNGSKKATTQTSQAKQTATSPTPNSSNDNKNGKERHGQEHHILSNKIMEAINKNDSLRGLFDGSKSIIQAFEMIDHIGYQAWHRAVDYAIVEWLSQFNGKSIDPLQLIQRLLIEYSKPEVLQKFGEEALDVIRNLLP